MDTDAIGDLVDKLKAIQNDNVEDQDQDDDFDDDDDDDEEHEPITLGFVDKPKNNWSLRRQYFPSKAGGVPVLYRLIEFVYTLLLSCFIQRTKESVSDGHMICCDAWLDPLNIPSGGSFVCDNCGDPLQFLLQVYAPTEKETTFHRMLFVFMCPSMKCLLRDQHEQWKRHPEKPSKRFSVVNYLALIHFTHLNALSIIKATNLLAVENLCLLSAALCDWCGTWKGDKLCSGCRQARYCSEKHQVMELLKCIRFFSSTNLILIAFLFSPNSQVMSWRTGHKIACQQMKVSSPVSGPNKSGTASLDSHKVGSKNLWPEFEITIEDESDYKRDMSEENTLANSLISRNRTDDTMNSLLDNFQGDDDKKSWASFQQCIAKAPEQVLRERPNATSFNSKKKIQSFHS
ncbi:hypothetical protein JHK82_033029 [Glycine max]|nr:hypothetical protein JHK85_033736 [Glycine max]KAG5118609.1 hypothetical protein JHK82_033029 [Glycine max]KAG5139597.1 hypothetical protein JHK84_033365 [Glycine max]